MTQTPPRTAARRDIQGLRALAVAGVVLAHVIGWPRGGFVGVDVFFVISGFLITALLLRELAATGRLSLRDFFARRIRRIAPAAAVVLLAVVAAAFAVFSHARAEQTLWDAVASAALVANWRFAAEGTDYFTMGDAVSPLQHFWSLSVEEQFYLVWPVLVLLAVLLVPAAGRRRAAPAVVGVLALVAIVLSAGWATLQTPTSPTVAYFSTATRAWELAVGALLAVGAPLLARLPGGARGPLGWTGAVAVVASFFVIDPAMPFPAPWAALPVAGAALVIAGGIGGDPRQRHLFPLTNPLAVFVGDLSYSLYLWHFPVLVFAGMLLPTGGTATAIVFGAIVVLTLVSYFGIEQPLHRSPWLRRPGAERGAAASESVPVVVASPPAPATAMSAAAAPAAAAPAADPAPSAAARTASRPEGWVPGRRYFPGSPAPAALSMSRNSPPESPSADHLRDIGQPEVGQGAPERRAGAAGSETRAATTPGTGTPGTGTPGTGTPGTGTPGTGTPVTGTPPTGMPGGEAPGGEMPPEQRPWSRWRARFGAQIGFAGAGLALGAGAVVVALIVAYGAPTPGPVSPPVAAAEEPAAAAASLEGEIAAAVGATEWPELHPSLDDVIARSSSDNPARDCFAPDIRPDPAACTWGAPDAARHLYLVGDSSAMAYAPTFKRLAEESAGAWRVTTVGLYGCRFTDVLVQNDGTGIMAACPQRKLDVRAMVGADPADLVVVSNAYTLGRTVDGRDLDATALQLAVQAEVGTYGAAGRVVYLAPPPHGADLARCYSPLSSPASCLSAIDPTWFEMEAAAEAVAGASGDHAVASLSFSCWQDVCPAFAGDLPIRYDQNHLTVAYAERIAPVMRDALAALALW